MTIQGCILLLNGWEPMSIDERTSAAPIVASAYVHRTFTEIRTDVDTYSAEVSLLEIYKGKELVQNLSSDDHLEADYSYDKDGESDKEIDTQFDTEYANVGIHAKLYNISNFGDEIMCYSDVTAGESYILFLTDFEGSLSARYDDIFGAATAYNEKHEAEVLQSLGKMNISLEATSYLEIYIYKKLLWKHSIGK